VEHRHFLADLFEPSSVLLVVDDDPPQWVRVLITQMGEAAVPTRVLRLNHARHHAAEPAAGAPLALLALTQAGITPALVLVARLGAHAVSILLDPADCADRAGSMDPAGPGDPRAPINPSAWHAQAAALGLRLLGPGTMGFIRPPLQLNAGRMGPTPHSGPVALVSQSGMLNAALLDWVADYSVGFSLVVSLGAQADVDLAQVLDYLATDAQTRSVVVYLDAVRDARRFMSALRALAAIKPVIVLKGDRHDSPLARGSTHAGALCGADAVYSAAFRRAGAVQVSLFTQLFTAARILAADDGVLGLRLAVLGNGKGPGVLVADQARFQHLHLPALTQATQTALTPMLPGRVITNPLNLGEGAGADEYAGALAALAADPQIDGILVMMSPYSGVAGEAITRAVIATVQSIRKPVFACWLGDRVMRPLARLLDAAGVPVYSVPEAAVDAYATVARFHQNQRLLQQTAHSLSGLHAPDLAGARRLIETALAGQRTVLDARESRALLKAFHVPLARAAPAQAQSQAGLAGQSTHARPHGRELYVGVFRDPLFGPVIAFGAGGTRIEVFRDATLEFAPLNPFLAHRMIERTRVAETLGPCCDAPAIDWVALEALLVRVSEMVCELPWIAEMDINPVIADAHGLMVLEACVVLDAALGADPPRHRHLAIMPYPAHFTREIVAPDGSRYTLRAIRSEDADRLQAFVRGLSAQSRYFRFISMLSELPARMLVRYTQIDYDRELALVAVVSAEPLGGTTGDAEHIVGVVRYLLNADRDSCEFAIAIADAWHGRQLGSTLMRALIEAARTQGLRRIEGYVLSTNNRMLALMTWLGFTVKTDPQDGTMKLVWLDLVPAAPEPPTLPNAVECQV
jgi:acetyltransferase